MSEFVIDDWKLKARTVVVDEFNSESTDSQLNAEHWFARIKKSYHRNSCLIVITNYLNLKMPIMH